MIPIQYFYKMQHTSGSSCSNERPPSLKSKVRTPDFVKNGSNENEEEKAIKMG